MYYITLSQFHCSKGLLNYVVKITNIPGNVIGYMFNTNFPPIEQQYKELANCFNKPKGKKKFIIPIFGNEILSSSKIFKYGPKDCVFSNQT